MQQGWRMFVCALMMATTLTIGCQRAPLPVVPVKGKITYGGGNWPQPGYLYFTVQNPGPDLPRKPGTAVLNVDGTFAAGTFQPGDGLVPGTYLLNIECWETPPSPTTPGVSCVPAAYQNGQQSGFKVEVPADATEPIELNFDVPKK